MEATKKLPVVREDLYRFRFVSEVSLSPDGTKAVYAVNRADQEKNGYASSVWLADLKTGENRLLAERGNAKNPVWLDDSTVLFKAERPEAAKQASETTYFAIPVCGGEAQLYMTVPEKTGKAVRVKDGLWLLQATADDFKEQEALKTKDGEEEITAVRGVDYEVYEELPFWFNGKGFRSRKREALYLFSKESGELKCITPEFLDVTAFDVSADGGAVAFCGPCYDSIKPVPDALYCYRIENGQTKRITDGADRQTGHVCFMGNDRIFYTATPFGRMGRNPRFYVHDLGTGETKELPFCDADIGNGVGSDAKYGANRVLAYCEGDGLLYMVQTAWGDSHLMTLDCSGSAGLPVKKTALAGAVAGFDIKYPQGADKPVIVLNAMRGTHLSELYLLDPATGEERKLTAHNDEYLETHEISEPESFRYAGKNGYEMEGYVMKPADYVPGTKYPAVFEIHGGPKGVDGTVFFHEFQCLASAGYFVFYGNPRGSDGRGEEYADITESFGKNDVADLMELCDETLKRFPDIDGTRIGICGGSYGGFMCNWLVGHTNRFAAAVSQRSISNYLTKCLYTDIGYYANKLQMGAYPWEDFDKVWSMSPLSGMNSARTPILFLQSDEDYRCYMGDAIQMFSAVKRLGTDTRMILFHGENHELSRSGKPQNRMTRLDELMKWFEKYLK